MQRKKLVGVVLGLALAVSVVHAALPLLAFAEVAAAVVESFVVRSVGRQVVVTVGTAANDATWAQTFLSWAQVARVVGSLVFTEQDGRKIEVQVSPTATADLTKGPLGLVWGPSGNSVYVPASLTLDGVGKAAPAGSFVGEDPAALMAAAIAWFNATADKRGPFSVVDTNIQADLYEVYLQDANGYGSSIWLAGQNKETSDGIRRLLGKPGAWNPDSTDPDWTAEEKTRFTGVQALRLRGQENDQLDVYPVGSAAGAVRYQQATAPGEIRELATMLNNAYVPVATSTATFPGSLAAVGESASAGTSEVVFPDDYARVGEAASAASAVVAAVDALKTAPEVPEPELAQTTAEDLQGAFLGDENNPLVGLLGWSVPAHVAVCPTADINISWSLISYSGRFENHCDIAEDFRTEAALIFDALWALLAFFIVLGA